MSIPTSSEEHALFEVHDASVNRVSELKNALADTVLFDGPLSKSAVIRTGEKFAQFLAWLQVSDLVCVADVRERRRVFFTGL